MLLDDVLKLVVIYSLILVGFAIAFHVVLFADGSYCVPDGPPMDRCSSHALDQFLTSWNSFANSSDPAGRRLAMSAFDGSAFACTLADGMRTRPSSACDSNPPMFDDVTVFNQKNSFKDVRSSILTVSMMTMSEWKTEAMQGGGHDATSKALLLFLYATYIILTNLLLLNLLIALLNSTFQNMSDKEMFKAAQIFQRTLVVRGGLERLDRSIKSKYERFLYPDCKLPAPPFWSLGLCAGGGPTVEHIQSSSDTSAHPPRRRSSTDHPEPQPPVLKNMSQVVDAMKPFPKVKERYSLAVISLTQQGAAGTWSHERNGRLMEDFAEGIAKTKPAAVVVRRPASC